MGQRRSIVYHARCRSGACPHDPGRPCAAAPQMRRLRGSMPSLAEIQDAFATALLDRTSPVPAFLAGAARHRPERRFAVYRNNVAAGLVEALATRFPVVKRLVGDEFFRAMAHLYAMAE